MNDVAVCRSGLQFSKHKEDQQDYEEGWARIRSPKAIAWALLSYAETYMVDRLLPDQGIV